MADLDREELKGAVLAKMDETAEGDAPKYGAGMFDFDLKDALVNFAIEKVIGGGADYLEANKDAVAGSIADWVEQQIRYLIDNALVIATNVQGK